MQTANLLKYLFEESYAAILDAIGQVSHQESVRPGPLDGGSIHWIAGHVVVARCNFMTILGVPSIWDMPTCRLFIPGSTSTPESIHAIGFEDILQGLGKTQNQLLDVLDRMSEADLGHVKDGKAIWEHVAEYASHEALHAGQLSMVGRLGDPDAS